MNDIGLRSSWDPHFLKALRPCRLRAPRAQSARGPAGSHQKENSHERYRFAIQLGALTP